MRIAKVTSVIHDGVISPREAWANVAVRDGDMVAAHCWVATEDQSTQTSKG
jgi:hypothetical protein